jgi:hypothetical protein
MKINVENVNHYGDILAIPFFGLLMYYFYRMEHKSPIEYVLFFFCISGFILDILYTYIYFYKIKTVVF